MREFLHTVANHYYKSLLPESNGQTNYLKATDWMFIFPNRRAGLFFGKYLCDRNDNRPLLSPRCISVGDLFSLFSDVRVADRTELLFRLFNAYQKVLHKGKEGFEPAQFEKFLFWGEMLLRDFDEVDKYLVDAKALFTNINDLKSIEEEFSELNDETRQVLATFWTNVLAEKSKKGHANRTFTKTWAILHDVYQQFRQDLRETGICYEGMRQRDVVERIVRFDDEQYLQSLPKHIVLVGITAINRTERELLLWLKQKGILECCWDYASEAIKDLPFVQENLKDFGNALSDEELHLGVVPLNDPTKKMIRISVPSGVGQATEAQSVLQGWAKEDAFHTAVVLPDEQLLNPMLYNLPREYELFNVTMGYPLKSTPVASLADALIYLRRNIRRNEEGKLTFFYKAVLPILSHSFLLDLDMEECTRLGKEISDKSLYQVPQETLCINDLLTLIFDPKKAPIPYFRDIFNYLRKAFAAQKEEDEEEEPDFKADTHSLMRECLISYLQIIDRIDKEVKTTGVAIDNMTLLRLITKLANGQSVSFSGEPMQGLQVMGVLETRAIDFDRIVILSMNEGIVPAKASQNSYIPHSLRQAFDLPTQIFKDHVFAYHFYRLISRASEVVFIYDSRTEGLQSGEQSRYLLQMQYLNGVQFEDRVAQPEVNKHVDDPIVIEKTEAVMQQLKAFISGEGDRNLSASNLKTYLECPLQFYLGHVCQLAPSDEMEEEMADSKFGTIVHNVLKEFYENCKGKWVQADILKQAADETKSDLIAKLVKAEYQKVFLSAPDTGYQQLVCTLIETFVRSVLLHDASITPFYYLAGEKTIKMSYAVNDRLSVNLKAVFDRLDVVHEPDGTNSLRIVDYKTGRTDMKCSIEDLNGCSKEAFQVLLYCSMFGHIGEEDRRKMNLLPVTEQNVFQHLQPHLYFVRSFLNQEEEDNSKLLDDFYGTDKSQESIQTKVELAMKGLLEEIFDPTKPFIQTDNDNKKCKYCKFLTICNKSVD